MTNKEKEAVWRMEQARKRLAGCLRMKQGGSAMEAQYAVSYKQLVAMGVMPKLRGKYGYPG